MKKLTAILMSVVMILLMSVTSFAAFTDMPQGEDGEVLQRAVDNGLITGFPNGTIQPGTAITRAQMATIMTRAMETEETADISEFVDVKPGEWYYNAMAKAVYMEAFKGDNKKKLNPNNTITRQEALLVLCRIFNVPATKGNPLSVYKDGNKVADWAKKEVGNIAAAGYLGNISHIRPTDPMTRLEFAQIMDRLVSTYIDEAGEYTTLPAGNVLVRADNVSFKGVKTNGVIFIGDGVKTEVGFTDCEVERIVIRGKKVVLYSGTYAWVYAIGKGTELHLEKLPIELVKKFPDGSTGKFGAASGKAIIVLPTLE